MIEYIEGEFNCPIVTDFATTFSPSKVALMSSTKHGDRCFAVNNDYFGKMTQNQTQWL